MVGVTVTSSQRGYGAVTPHQGSVIPFTSIPRAASLSSQSSPTFCWSSNTATPTLTAGPEVQHRAHPDPKGVRAMSRAPLCPPTAPGGVGSGGTGRAPCAPGCSRPCTHRLVSGNAVAGRALPASQILTLGAPHPSLEVTFLGLHLTGGIWILVLCFPLPHSRALQGPC